MIAETYGDYILTDKYLSLSQAYEKKRINVYSSSKITDTFLISLDFCDQDYSPVILAFSKAAV